MDDHPHDELAHTDAYDDSSWSVLVKFKPGTFDGDYPDGAEKRLPEHRRQQWDELQEQYGPLTLSRRFTTLPPEALRALANRAKARQELGEKESLYNDYPAAAEMLANAEAPSLPAAQFDFDTYFQIDVSSQEVAIAIAERLDGWEEIVQLTTLLPPPAPQPFDCRDYQGYLDGETGTELPPVAGYQGIRARPVWAAVGAGAAVSQGMVTIGVIERRWNLQHNDLDQGAMMQVAGNCPPALSPAMANEELRHAIADLGVLAARNNGVGCTGIAYGAPILLASSNRCNRTRPDAIADAIVTLLAQLQPGDVLLIEEQIRYPRDPNQPGASINPANEDTYIYAPVEFSPDTFEAIRLATALGVTVIEPAGNKTSSRASVDLQPYFTRYEQWLRQQGLLLPGDPFDSGATLVGACVPQAQQRHSSSNYGMPVRCCAWGSNVTTLDLNDGIRCGYNGTSAASAIIAGAAALLQSIVSSTSMPLTPTQLRTLLSDPNFGVEPDPNRGPVGVMPDLQRIVTALQTGAYVVRNLFIRDSLVDVGAPGGVETVDESPDIAFFPLPVAGTPAGLDDPNVGPLGVTSLERRGHAIFVRISNRTGQPLQNILVRLFWARPNELHHRALWHEIGAQTLPTMDTDFAVLEPFGWSASALPPAGDYTVVVMLHADEDPTILRVNNLNVNTRIRVIGVNNNLAIRRIKVL